MHASYIFSVVENILKFYFTGQQIKREMMTFITKDFFLSYSLYWQKHLSFYEVP